MACCLSVSPASFEIGEEENWRKLVDARVAFWGRKDERGGMEVRERTTTWRMKVRNSEEVEEAILWCFRGICLEFWRG